MTSTYNTFFEAARRVGMLVILTLLMFISVSAQVRPDHFPEEVNPTNSNFEVYSQKGGVNRRASLNNLKKAVAPAIVLVPIVYVPTQTGNVSNLTDVVIDPFGSIWYIDGVGDAIELGSTGIAIDTAYVIGDTTILINNGDTLYIPHPGGGIDSLVTCDDGVFGFIVEADTICISMDSVFFSGDCVFGIQMGDTVMVCSNGAGGDFYVANGTIVNTPGNVRLVDMLSAAVHFRRGTSNRFSINADGSTSIVTIRGGSIGVSIPQLQLIGINQETGGSGIHLGGLSTESHVKDYSIWMSPGGTGSFVLSETNTGTDPFIRYWGLNDSLVIEKGIMFKGVVWDSDGDLPDDNDVLTGQADGTVKWEPGGGGVGVSIGNEHEVPFVNDDEDNLSYSPRLTYNNVTHLFKIDSSLLINGVLGTTPTKVSVLKNGILEWDMTNNTNDTLYYTQVIQPIQKDEGSQPFLTSMKSTLFAGWDRRTHSWSTGFNLAPGGGVHIPGETGFGLVMEKDYYNAAGDTLDEIHVFNYSKSGVQRRPWSIIMSSDNPDQWYGYNNIDRWFFSDPTNGSRWLEFDRNNDQSTYINFYGSNDAADRFRLFSWPAAGYFSLMSEDIPGVVQFDVFPDKPFESILKCQYFNFQGSGAAIISPTGRDAAGFLTTSTWDTFIDSLIANGLVAPGVGGIDSIISCEGGIGFIIMGDTTCISTDSIFFEGDCVYGISMGDTMSVCVPSGTPGLNLGNSNLSYTNTPGGLRIVDVDTAMTSFRSGIFRYVEIAGDENPNLQVYNSNSDTRPTIRLNGSQFPNNDIFIQINGTAANEDFSFGLDDSDNAFVLSNSNFLGDPWYKYWPALDSSVFYSRVQFDAIVHDSDGDTGAEDQVFTAKSDGTTDWADPSGSGGPVPINDLEPADGTNSINNLNYEQEWMWNALQGTALRLSTTSTAAASNLQRMLEILLAGANANSDQATHGIYVSNVHSGTNSTNYGGRFHSSGGTHNYGLIGSAVGTSGTVTGVWGASSYALGRGVFAENSGAGYGLWAESEGIAALAYNTLNDDTVEPILEIRRAGNDQDGVGGAIDFQFDTETGSLKQAGLLSYKWTESSSATATSLFELYTSLSGTSSRKLAIDGAGKITGDAYDTTPPTGTMFGLVAHESTGGYISADWNDVMDTLAAYGLTGGGGGPTAFNELTDAEDINSIDNGNYEQGWSWNGLSNVALNLNSTSTAAADDDQTLLQITMSGANATAGEGTQALHVRNEHTGTGSVNYAGRFSATGGGVNYGVHATSSGASSFAIHGTNSSGVGTYGSGATGVYGTGTTYGMQAVTNNATGMWAIDIGNGVGLSASSGTGRAFIAAGALASTINVLDAGTNDVVSIASLYRGSTGTPANGLGASLSYGIETSTTADVTAGAISYLWSDITHASRKSRAELSTVHNGSTSRKLAIDSEGRMTLDGYVSGAFASTSAADSIMMMNKTTGVVSYIHRNSVGGGGGSPTNEFEDDVFRVLDDGDNTKELAFQLSGITTATTRTLTVPNASTTIVGTDVTQTLTNKRVNKRVVTLIDGANIAVNSDITDIGIVTLGGNRTLDNPTGTPVDGQPLTLRFRQDGTGSRTISYGSAYRFGSDITGTTLTATANKEDYVHFVHNITDGKWDCVGLARGY